MAKKPAKKRKDNPKVEAQVIKKEPAKEDWKDPTAGATSIFDHKEMIRQKRESEKQ